MHPQNIFGEAVLLFVIAIILLVRDRGASVSSTNYDALLAGVLFVFSLIRLNEFIATGPDSHVAARAVVWLMWTLPSIITGWLYYHHRRLDLLLLLIANLVSLAVATVFLISGDGGFDLLLPNTSSGGSSGVYCWVRTDGCPLFMSVYYYALLTITLIYLTAFCAPDQQYLLFAGVTAISFGIGAIAVPQVMKTPVATLGSLATLVMLGIGVLAIFIAPG
jgi:hypothetical protein